MIAERKDPVLGAVKSVWQAKKNRPGRKVSLTQVRELSGVLDIERATKGMIVTTSHLTRGAVDWVQRDHFRLGYLEKDTLERWVLGGAAGLRGG